MAEMIEPKVLKGFRDSLPEGEGKRKTLIQKLEKVFELFGYQPIDTPVLEYTQVLLGKGGGETDKQMFRFEDNGGRDVALRFDLTVPFARFMAANHSKLVLPFRRYHIAKVWRGENTQKGRYREFFQCDFDIVGTRSVMADMDTLLLMVKAMDVLGVPSYEIKINHRGLFHQLLSHLHISDHSTEILRIVDKLSKIGEQEVSSLLEGIITKERTKDILDFVQKEANNKDTLKKMERLSGGPSEASKRLGEILDLLDSQGLSSYFILDPSIARGLDYYTGVVFETFLRDLPQIGSVCSGGRYDQLANLYTKEDLPGVGASVGLDRLLAGLEELGIEMEDQVKTQVLILHEDSAHSSEYLKAAQFLRQRGIGVEIYPQKKKLPAQYTYGEKKRIPFALILEKGTESILFSMKELSTGERFDGLSLDMVLERLSI